MGILEEPVRWNGESNAGERCSNEELHQKNPVAFCSEQVDQRAPEGLDDPGEVEPACVKGDVSV